MSAQHTPGPWEMCYDKGSTRDILSRKHGGICVVRRAGVHNDATYNANARLIASAPELIAALIAMVEAEDASCDDFGAEQIDAIERAMEQARAAIAKTKGGAA